MLRRCFAVVVVVTSVAQSTPARSGTPEKTLDSSAVHDMTAEELDAYSLDTLLDLRVTAATQHEIPVLWSPSAISVYLGDEIRASGVRTLADFLRRVPGLDVYMMEPAYSLVGVRSQVDLGNNRLLVTVDGREELMEMVGFPVWTALATDLEEIERVEVVRGPASTLYGPNAFLGVIAVTTTKESKEVDEGAHAKALVRLGSLRSRQMFAQASHTQRLSNGRLEAETHVRQSGLGTPSDPEYLQLMPYHINGRLRFAGDDGTTASLLMGGGRMRFALPTPWDELDLRAGQRLHLVAEATKPLSSRWSLFTRGYFNRYASRIFTRSTRVILGLPVADPLPSTETMLTGDGQLRLSYSTATLLLTWGAMFRHTVLRQDVWVPRQDRETRAGLFGHAQWRASERTQLVGGLRLDVNTATRPVLTPRLVLNYLTGPEHALRVAAQLGFRKPYFLEYAIHPRSRMRPEGTAALASSDEVMDIFADSVGNAGLRHETVQSLEAGWWGQFYDGGLDVGAQLFLNRFVDLIIVPQPSVEAYLSSTERQSMNYANAETPHVSVGGELEARWRNHAGWRLWANLTVRHTVDTADATERLATTDPRFRINFGGGYGPPRGLVLDLAAHFVSRYEAQCPDPRETFERLSQRLGNTGLLFALLAYRFGPLKQVVASLEVGATVQLPVPARHREYVGVRADDVRFFSPHNTVASDLLAEEQTTVLSAYVRAQL